MRNFPSALVQVKTGGLLHCSLVNVAHEASVAPVQEPPAKAKALAVTGSGMFFFVTSDGRAGGGRR